MKGENWFNWDSGFFHNLIQCQKNVEQDVEKIHTKKENVTWDLILSQIFTKNIQRKKRKKSLNITAHSVNEALGRQALTLMKLLTGTNLKTSWLLTLNKFKHVYTWQSKLTSRNCSNDILTYMWNAYVYIWNYTFLFSFQYYID